jgi:hypothetical protein
MLLEPPHPALAARAGAGTSISMGWNTRKISCLGSRRNTPHDGAAMKAVTVTLASSTASRIGQLVRLLGSDRSGEVVAAAAAIKRSLFVAGADIHHLADVAERALQSAPPIAPKISPADDIDDINVAAMIRFCVNARHRLNEREVDFVRNMHQRLLLVGNNFEPTEKQLAWLLNIHQRLRSQR